MKILLSLLLAAVCAILYRAGGMSQDDTAKPKWIPKWMRKSWVRDWLIPPLIYLSLFVHPWWLILPAIALTGFALTTYWDKLFKYDNFWFAGFMVGLAAFPLFWAGIHWYMILARAILLAVLWGGWCAIFKDDVIEEMGRGAFIALTLLLL